MLLHRDEAYIAAHKLTLRCRSLHCGTEAGEGRRRSWEILRAQRPLRHAQETSARRGSTDTSVAGHSLHAISDRGVDENVTAFEGYRSRSQQAQPQARQGGWRSAGSSLGARHRAPRLGAVRPAGGRPAPPWPPHSSGGMGRARQVCVLYGATQLSGREAGKEVVELRQREAGLGVGTQHLQEPGEPHPGVLELRRSAGHGLSMAQGRFGGNPLGFAASPKNQSSKTRVPSSAPSVDVAAQGEVLHGDAERGSPRPTGGRGACLPGRRPARRGGAHRSPLLRRGRGGNLPLPPSPTRVGPYTGGAARPPLHRARGFWPCRPPPRHLGSSSTRP